MRLNRWKGGKSLQAWKRFVSGVSGVVCFFCSSCLFHRGCGRLCRGKGFEHEQTDSLKSHCPHHRSLRSKLYIIHQPSPGSSEHARIYSQKIISESKPFSPFPRSPASPPSSIIDIKLYFISKYDCHYPRQSPELEVSPR